MKEETYRRPAAGDHPPNLSPDYKSTTGRAPRKPAVVLPHSLSEITGPLLTNERLDAGENDLTRQRMAEPLASGRVLAVDRAAGRITLEFRPIPQLLLEGGKRVFRVKDPTSLKDVNAGDKVRFEVERNGRSYLVTRVENRN